MTDRYLVRNYTREKTKKQQVSKIKSIPQNSFLRKKYSAKIFNHFLKAKYGLV